MQLYLQSFSHKFQVCLQTNKTQKQKQNKNPHHTKKALQIWEEAMEKQS